ncbi:hypothetical protein D1007_61431 [Hordeum vulgare]|nr:hypothetical protein D1007_61431 [Hordeum vulgare]
MERVGGTPLISSYTSDPSPTTVATATNPSAGLSIVAAGADPLSGGHACSLFMAPRSTALGVVAPPPAVKPWSPIKRLNAATMPRPILKCVLERAPCRA